MPVPVIPITGVGADFRTPGAYAEILFAQGPASAAAPNREVVLAMPMLSTGTWTAGTLYPIRQEADASTGAGVGSFLHRAARIFLQANRTARLWGLPVAETSGGTPAAATTIVTVATNATGVGTAVITITGVDCSYTFKANDTVTTIAAGLVTSINSQVNLPVTASAVAGAITITAKLKGISSGDGTVSVIRIRVSITAGIGTTITTAGAFLGASAAGVEGSTTEATNLATALANIINIRKYYVVVSANDATSIGNLQTHVLAKSQPRYGLRSVGIASYSGVLASAITLATGRNNARTRIAWAVKSESDNAQIAANYAAILQKHETVDSAFNFNGYGPGNGDWFVKPAYLSSDFPTVDDQSDAINGGLTPIAYNDAGSYVVMSCSTQSKNSSGSVNDFRATETKQVSVTDEFVDQELIDWALNDASKKFRDDDRLADGSVNPNQKLVRGVLTPSQRRSRTARRMDDFFKAGKIQDVDLSKASIATVKTGSRLEMSYDLRTIDWANQLTERVSETSTG